MSKAKKKKVFVGYTDLRAWHISGFTWTSPFGITHVGFPLLYKSKEGLSNPVKYRITVEEL